ncbi:hypothetical protein AAVH_40277, partial [Aphelenchoides avenae]
QGLKSHDADVPLTTATGEPVKVRGTSLFKPLPQPRTCDSLGIPFEFCHCSRQLRPFSADDLESAELGRLLAQFLVDELNGVLERNNASSICCALQLDSASPPLVKQVNPGSPIRAFNVQFRVKPSGGRFSGFVRVLDDGRLWRLSSAIERLDIYGEQSH